jgi:hypothetical protein
MAIIKRGIKSRSIRWAGHVVQRRAEKCIKHLNLKGRDNLDDLSEHGREI